MSDTDSSMELFWRVLTREVCAGVRLVNALERAQHELGGTDLGGVCAELKQDILAGKSLAQAMRRHESVFREHVLLLVDGGEHAGILDRVLLLILEYAWRCPECILGQRC